MKLLLTLTGKWFNIQTTDLTNTVENVLLFENLKNILNQLETALVHGQRGSDENRVTSQKRYFQLTDMMENYNDNFDERKYWSYGCNCLILGDRPMSDPGLGRPVDELDSVCKAYKDCLKCARRQYGDMCIGEFVKYDYRIRRGEVKCKNEVLILILNQFIQHDAKGRHMRTSPVRVWPPIRIGAWAGDWCLYEWLSPLLVGDKLGPRSTVHAWWWRRCRSTVLRWWEEEPGLCE